MKKHLIALLLVTAFVFSCSNDLEKQSLSNYKNNGIEIINHTKFNVDTICADIFRYENIDKIRLIVSEMNTLQVGDELEIKAFVKKVGDTDYSLSLSKDFNKRILCHEIAHIVDYYNKDLVDVRKGVWIYKGDTITTKTPYEIRKFERHAEKKSKEYLKEVLHIEDNHYVGIIFLVILAIILIIIKALWKRKKS